MWTRNQVPALGEPGGNWLGKADFGCGGGNRLRLNVLGFVGSGQQRPAQRRSAPGSDFIAWSDGCSGSGACALVMDAPKTVTARFALSRVVFSSGRKLDGTDAPNANGTYNIWQANADGTGLRTITNAIATGADSLSPSFSP